MAQPTFPERLAQAEALRAQCAPVWLPLFDHMLALAADSRRQFEAATYPGRSYLARRAGRELSKAIALAQRAVCPVCGYVIRDGSGNQCAWRLDNGDAGHVPGCWKDGV